MSKDDLLYCFAFIGLCSLLFLVIPIKINTVKEDFDLYLVKYNKSYNSSEYERRLKIFEKSVGLIDSFNLERSDISALYGITEFTDLIPEVFLADLYQQKSVPVIVQQSFRSPSELRIPIKVDWRYRGIITDVNNQKACGACWAFTTIETVEAMNALKIGRLEKLSVQQMIDCSFVNDGCNGGDACLLLQWIKHNDIGILREEEYPLYLVDGKCKMKNTTAGVHVKMFKCQNLLDQEHVILQYLAHVGPVVAAVNAASWHYFVHGIIQYHCDGSPSRLNHAVQIVGYDMSGRVPYYIVRNSWGKNFGIDGYLKIAIGRNMCGIAQKIVSLIV